MVPDQALADSQLADLALVGWAQVARQQVANFPRMGLSGSPAVQYLICIRRARE
ncbi:MAG: hypothetical protein WBX19_03915 [Terracidiphilus sp.]